jgi:hypothetical protein
MKENNVGSFRYRGTVPVLATRLGYIKNGYLFFGKLGLAFHNIEGRYPVNYLFLKSAAPTCCIGLGVEKALCRKFSARLDGEYSFGHKNKSRVDTFIMKTHVGQGFSVRILIAYNIKY